MRCLDEAALKKHVADFPDLTQNERASQGITRKKKTLGYKERCDEKRQVIVRHLGKR